MRRRDWWFLGFVVAWLALVAVPASAVAPVSFGAGIRRVLDEGVYVSSPGAIDCVGANVSCTASGNTVTIAVSGGGTPNYQTIEENDTPLTGRANIDFQTGLIATDAAPDTEINIDTTSAFNPTWAGNHTFTPYVTLTAGARAGDGSQSSPTYAFADDTDSGIYSTANGTIVIGTDNSPRVTINASNITVTEDIDGVAGSSNDPGISFGDPDTGIYASSGGYLNIANNNNQTVRFFPTNQTAFSGDTSVGNGKLMVKTHTGFSETEWNMDTAAVSTADATVTTIYTRATTSNRMIVFDVLVGAIETGTFSESAIYRRQFRSENDAGVLTLGTITTLGEDEDDATWDVTVTTSGTNVLVRVTGEAATTIRWALTVRWQEIGGA